MGKNSKTVLVGDADCTGDGESLCQDVGVQGYPTIKYGDPSALEDYSGGRDFDELKKFTEELKPMCSPANIDLCDDDKKKEIAEFQQMSEADLSAKIEEKRAEIKTAESTFEEEVKKLQDTYSQLQKDKDETIANVKKSGLGLMQAVAAAQKKAKEEL